MTLRSHVVGQHGVDYRVKLSGEDLSRCSNKNFESVGLTKYPNYQYFAEKVMSQ